MLAAVNGTAGHMRRNRAAWDRLAAEYAEPGLRMWGEPEPTGHLECRRDAGWRAAC